MRCICYLFIVFFCLFRDAMAPNSVSCCQLALVARVTRVAAATRATATTTTRKATTKRRASAMSVTRSDLVAVSVPVTATVSLSLSCSGRDSLRQHGVLWGLGAWSENHKQSPTVGCACFGAISGRLLAVRVARQFNIFFN